MSCPIHWQIQLAARSIAVDVAEGCGHLLPPGQQEEVVGVDQTGADCFSLMVGEGLAHVWWREHECCGYSRCRTVAASRIGVESHCGIVIHSLLCALPWHSTCVAGHNQLCQDTA